MGRSAWCIADTVSAGRCQAAGAAGAAGPLERLSARRNPPKIQGSAQRSSLAGTIFVRSFRVSFLSLVLDLDLTFQEFEQLFQRGKTISLLRPRGLEGRPPFGSAISMQLPQAQEIRKISTLFIHDESNWQSVGGAVKLFKL
jgi:hypothetical protein